MKSLLAFALFAFASVAQAAEPAGNDKVFVTVPAGQMIYTCGINTARGWPTAVTLADGLLAYCDAPTTIPANPGKRNGQQSAGSISDRPWNLTLQIGEGADVYNGCLETRFTLDQGSASFWFDCTTASP